MLQGVDNWGEKRSAKARELQYAALMNQMAEGDLQKQHLAGQQMQEYMNTVGKLKLLDPAIERVRAVNDELTRPIQEGIRNAGGDIKKYMLSGGINQLQKYKEQLINNPTVQKDLMSAFNYNKYSTDVQAGLVPRGNAQEDFQNYSKGTADYFQYQGGYKAPDLTNARKYFGETFGADKYAEQKVDPQTFYQFALQEAKKENLNQNDAQQFAIQSAQQYQNAVNQGAQPYMFKSLDPSIKMMNEARSRYYSGKSAASSQQPAEWWRTHLGNLPGNQTIAPDNSEVAKWGGSDSQILKYKTPMLNMDIVAGAHGIPMKDGVVENTATIISKDNGLGFVLPDGTQLDLSGLTPSQIKATGLDYLVDVNTPGKPSLASRNNNPGNLIFVGQAGASIGEGSFKDDKGKRYNYASFPTKEAGIAALKNQINIDAGRGMTLYDFIAKYAPTDKSAGNDSDKYFSFVKQKLGATGNPLVSTLDQNALMQAIMAQEGQGTAGQNRFKGSAFTFNLTEAAANKAKYLDKDGQWKPLEGILSNYQGTGIKKVRDPNKWFDMDVIWDGSDHSYDLTALMPHSKNPAIATQIAYQTKGTSPQQMGYFGGAMNQSQEFEISSMLQNLFEMSQGAGQEEQDNGNGASGEW